MRDNFDGDPTTEDSQLEVQPSLEDGRPPTRVAQAVEELVRHIVDRGLAPGDQLPTERELIRSLGLSRSVVREALRELQVQYVVEARHGHGIFVRPYGRELAAGVLSAIEDGADSLRSLTEARAAIEESAASYASSRATAADREDLQLIVGAMYEAARNGAVRRELDLEFHKVFVRSARNPYLLRFSAVIAEQFFAKGTLAPSSISRDSRGRALQFADRHRDLLRLLLRSNAADLQAAIRVHVFSPLWAAGPHDAPTAGASALIGREN